MKNKTILITGGANGIGRSLVEKLKKDNKIIILDIDREKCAQLRNNNNIMVYNIDITNEDGIIKIYNELRSKNINIDILINNAAIQIEEPNFINIKTELWEKVIQTNITGTFIVTKQFLKLMNKRSSILNINSVHANKPRISKFSYDASKSALLMFSKELALYLSPHKINVNSISLGAVNTKMNNYFMDKNIKNKAIKDMPLKHIFEPDEIAIMIISFIENFSEHTTGCDIIIDGGRNLK